MIHGHDVMQMMIEHGGPFTRESLERAIHTKFGADARFFTCSAEGMTASELIDFLEKRGKFVPAGEGFATDPSRICKH